MATAQQLKDAVYATLETNGSLNAIKARIRADIYAALDSQQPHQPPVQPSNTNLIINELLRDYLAYNNLHHTLSTLLVEANQPVQPPFDRAFLCTELAIADQEAQVGGGRVPLLYGMVAAMRGESKERREREREEKSVVDGKQEAGAARAAGVGSSGGPVQVQHSRAGSGGVDEKGMRTADAVYQQYHQQQQQQPQHRSQLSS